MNKFDRIRDWRIFSDRMDEYIQTPQTKYGTNMKFNDLCHYTGLRVMLWNILKYALRLWSGSGKKHDFEKIAHYAQMAWTLKERQGRKPPFFNEDIEGDYVVADNEKKKYFQCPDEGGECIVPEQDISARDMPPGGF